METLDKLVKTTLIIMFVTASFLFTVQAHGDGVVTSTPFSYTNYNINGLPYAERYVIGTLSSLELLYAMLHYDKMDIDQRRMQEAKASLTITGRVNRLTSDARYTTLTIADKAGRIYTMSEYIPPSGDTSILNASQYNKANQLAQLTTLWLDKDAVPTKKRQYEITYNADGSKESLENTTWEYFASGSAKSYSTLHINLNAEGDCPRFYPIDNLNGFFGIVLTEKNLKKYTTKFVYHAPSNPIRKEIELALYDANDNRVYYEKTMKDKNGNLLSSELVAQDFREEAPEEEIFYLEEKFSVEKGTKTKIVRETQLDEGVSGGFRYSYTTGYTCSEERERLYNYENGELFGHSQMEYEKHQAWDENRLLLTSEETTYHTGEHAKHADDIINTRTRESNKYHPSNSTRAQEKCFVRTSTYDKTGNITITETDDAIANYTRRENLTLNAKADRLMLESFSEFRDPLTCKDIETTTYQTEHFDTTGNLLFARSETKDFRSGLNKQESRMTLNDPASSYVTERLVDGWGFLANIDKRDIEKWEHYQISDTVYIKGGAGVAHEKAYKCELDFDAAKWDPILRITREECSLDPAIGRPKTTVDTLEIVYHDGKCDSIKSIDYTKVETREGEGPETVKSIQVESDGPDKDPQYREQLPRDWVTVVDKAPAFDWSIFKGTALGNTVTTIPAKLPSIEDYKITEMTDAEAASSDVYYNEKLDIVDEKRDLHWSDGYVNESDMELYFDTFTNKATLDKDGDLKNDLIGEGLFGDDDIDPDFNNDGVVDEDDLAILGSAVHGTVAADINGDGIVDSADVDCIIAFMGWNNSDCDVNGDGQVNGMDLNIVLSCMGLKTEYDVNGDGYVNPADEYELELFYMEDPDQSTSSGEPSTADQARELKMIETVIEREPRAIPRAFPLHVEVETTVVPGDEEEADDGVPETTNPQANEVEGKLRALQKQNEYDADPLITTTPQRAVSRRSFRPKSR